MADQDLSLTFTPDMFLKAVKLMGDKLDALEAHMGRVAGSTEHMEKKGAMAIGMWTAIATRGLGLIESGVRKMLSFIPEVGRSFQIAGDIIGRNLLWPLRQELIPVLQKMLNWVRDHRAMFVRWGNVIANVFRVIKGIVVGFWQIFKMVWDRVADGIRSVFGNTIHSITDMINIAVFRIAVIAAFIQTLLGPIFRFLVDRFLDLIRYSKAFIDGFKEGLGDITPVLNTFFDVISEIWKLIKELVPEIGDMEDTFRSLGQFLGGAFKATLAAIALFINMISEGVQDLIIGRQMEMYQPNSSQYRALQTQMDAMHARHAERSTALHGMLSGGLSSMGVGPSTGSMISSDTLAAAQAAGGGGTPGAQTTVHVAPTTIHINGATNPTETARQVDHRLRHVIADGITAGGGAP